MTTVLFVHGTGVRRAAYRRTLQAVRERMAAVRPDCMVQPCYWGEECGAVLHAGGASVPVVDSSRAVEPDESDPSLALWSLLDDDPLVELRLLAAAAAAGTELPPNRVPQAEEVERRARALVTDGELRTLLDALGLAGSFDAAVEAVIAAEPFRDAAEGGLDELRPALARAIVMEAVHGAERAECGLLPLDGDQFERLSCGVSHRLGDAGRSIPTTLAGFLVRAALRMGMTRPIERRRHLLTSSVSPASGDVLRYLVRGDPLRRYIAEAVRTLPRPVVILAHSLGGIAALEMLMSTVLPQVELGGR